MESLKTENKATMIALQVMTYPTTQKQLDCETARMRIVQAVLRLEAQGFKKIESIKKVIESEAMTEVIPIAKGKRVGSSKLGIQTVRDWIVSYELGKLKPKSREVIIKDEDHWFQLFLRYYRIPSKPSINRSLEALRMDHSKAQISHRQIRYRLEQMGSMHKAKGRMSLQALKALKPFIRRDTTHLLPGDLYVGDGHTFKAEVINPDSGRPFRPEVTIILDAATRVCVGWSVAFSENMLAVSDSLKNACRDFGIPAIYYGDNGRGQKNKALDDPELGILPRLGIEHATGLPYNSQARGLVERAHQTICIEAARKLPSFMHAKMDKYVSQKVFRDSWKGLKTQGKTDLIPSWEAFVALMRRQVEFYNQSPHSSLPKKTDKHLSPIDYWDASVNHVMGLEIATDEVLTTLFSP